MSDSDDWEKQLEDETALEQSLNKETKKKFKDEDAVDSDEERKKKQEEQKKAAQDAPAQPKKVKGGKKDYDKMFEERIAAKGGNKNVLDEKALAGLSVEARNAAMSRAAEQDITEQLFADLNVNSTSLNTEVDYVNFGKKVSDVLYEGQAPYRLPSFFKELVRDLKRHSDALKIKEILDSVTAIYNEKVKEEKEKEKTGKGKPKAQLKSGKNQISNNIIVNDLLGDDDYGDEEDYGEEGLAAGTKKKGGRVQEEEYDFM